MPSHLATLALENWKPLFRFIPRIQAKKGFGKWHYPKKESGVFIMPYFSFGRTEREFLKLVYRMQLVISFDWGKWGRTRSILRRDVSRLNILTLLKVVLTSARPNGELGYR